MQDHRRSPHRVELLTVWLKERIRRDEGTEWGNPALAGVCSLWGERGVWSYREEGNGECGFSVQSYSPPSEYDAPPDNRERTSKPPFGSLRMYPAPDNSTDIKLDGCVGQWLPYFRMLLKEMERPSLAIAVGAEEGELQRRAEDPSETDAKRDATQRGARKPRVPSRQPDLARWRRAYPNLIETQERYREIYEDGDTDDPKPKMDDYRDALASEMGWRPTERTIRKILAAGGGGLLD